jgi:2-phospho-L-lactate guanylyltransferase
VITVIPFRAGKTRLPAALRTELALAMLGDVVEAALGAGDARVVTASVDGADLAREVGATIVADPGGGQGAAVVAGLARVDAPALVLNADLPLVSTDALRRLAAAGPAFVAARDGTTNALSVTAPRRFRPRYGAESAARYAADGYARLAIPELEHDVDTPDDLRFPLTAGRRTTLVLNQRKLVPTLR